MKRSAYVFTCWVAATASAFQQHRHHQKQRSSALGLWAGSSRSNIGGAGRLRGPLQWSLEAFDAMSSASSITPVLSSSDAFANNAGSFLLAATAADYQFQGSYASLYTTLFLFVISFPGIISLVTRATKVKLDQRTYVLPGPALDSAKPLRQVAAEIMAYFQANNYKVAEAGETIVFKGAIEKSKSQAFFLSSCMFGGLWTLALVLSIGIPKIGPFEVDNLWYLITLPSPYAGWYYWKNAQVDGEIRVRLLTSDDEKQTEVTVQAGKEQIDQFATVMDYNEKGKIRVRGIFEEKPANPVSG